VHAGERVVADVRRDVLAREDRLDERAYFRFRGGERAGTELLRLGRPVGRPVAVEVEALERRRDRDGDAVPVSDRALREAVSERVSAIAERLIREEIERIKASIT